MQVQQRQHHPFVYASACGSFDIQLQGLPPTAANHPQAEDRENHLGLSKPFACHDDLVRQWQHKRLGPHQEDVQCQHDQAQSVRGSNFPLYRA